MLIQLDKCQLRSWSPEDADNLVKYANNANVANNLRDGFPHPYTIADARSWLQKAICQDLETIFAIATETEVIGGIGFAIGEDVHRKTAELGYWLGEPFWGQGIVTQAVTAITEFGFREFNLNRIYAEPYDYNTASCRVLEKAGFQLEGIMRKNVMKKGKVWDQRLYAITV
ncbi:MAG: GNAT family N-acetyltransferase [FCB group bacterium]|nr:GNAT family N-acetyltransferase [FCB group bacterium]